MVGALGVSRLFKAGTLSLENSVSRGCHGDDSASPDQDGTLGKRDGGGINDDTRFLTFLHLSSNLVTFS